LHNSASIISIANSALVNHSSRKGVQIASSSAVIAESLIAGSNQSLDSWNCQAIQGREEAASNRLAEILSAIVSIEASDVGVNTSNLWVASINGAISEVVAEASDVNIGMHASSPWNAGVDLAFVASVAVVLGVCAVSAGGAAGIICANISIITVDGSGSAKSGIRVADIVVAEDGGASDVDAHVARSRWKKNVLASTLGGTARIGVARISLVAVDGCVGASDGGIATGSVANI